jgi:hypothetical protein
MRRRHNLRSLQNGAKSSLGRERATVFVVAACDRELLT